MVCSIKHGLIMKKTMHTRFISNMTKTLGLSLALPDRCKTREGLHNLHITAPNLRHWILQHTLRFSSSVRQCFFLCHHNWKELAQPLTRKSNHTLISHRVYPYNHLWQLCTCNGLNCKLVRCLSGKTAVIELYSNSSLPHSLWRANRQIHKDNGLLLSFTCGPQCGHLVHHSKPHSSCWNPMVKTILS